MLRYFIKMQINSFCFCFVVVAQTHNHEWLIMRKMHDSNEFGRSIRCDSCFVSIYVQYHDQSDSRHGLLTLVEKSIPIHGAGFYKYRTLDDVEGGVRLVSVDLSDLPPTLALATARRRFLYEEPDQLEHHSRKHFGFDFPTTSCGNYFCAYLNRQYEIRYFLDQKAFYQHGYP